MAHCLITLVYYTVANIAIGESDTCIVSSNESVHPLCGELMCIPMYADPSDGVLKVSKVYTVIASHPV